MNFGNVTGVASTSTALITSAGIIKDINQGLGSAGAELMQEYVNATGGPGGYVVQTTGENMGSYAWDPSATPDSPGFIPPGQWLWLSSGEHLYYTSQTDVHVEHRTLGEVEIVSTSIMSTEAKVMLALDILENPVPGLNLVIAAGKAAYYLSQGNITEVGWAVAGLFGGDIIRAACTVMVASAKVVQYSYKAIKAAVNRTKTLKKVDEVVAAVDEVAEVATKKADEIYTYDIGGGITCSQPRPKRLPSTSDVAKQADEVVEVGDEAIELATSSVSMAPSRTYTIYDGTGNLYKFGVTDEGLKRYSQSLTEAGPNSFGRYSSVMPKFEAHSLEKYLRSLQFNSTGQWVLPGMKIPYPVDFTTLKPIRFK